MAWVDMEELRREYWGLHIEYFERSYAEDFDPAFHEFYQEELYERRQLAITPEDYDSANEAARKAAWERARKRTTEKAEEYADRKLVEEYMAANHEESEGGEHVRHR